MIFVNFKTYAQGSGEEAESLVGVIGEVVEETGVKFIPVVQAVSVGEICSFSKLEIWVQGVDPVEYGAHTASTLPQAVFEAGARGTFLNHSERKMEKEGLSEAVLVCKEVGLKQLVFASDLDELSEICKLAPSFVSYEPPSLIGSSKSSVSSEEPEVIKKAVLISKKAGIPLVVGAGIHSREDVKTALGFGVSGFAVASDVLKAKNPKKELVDLAEGYK